VRVEPFGYVNSLLRHRSWRKCDRNQTAVTSNKQEKKDLTHKIKMEGSDPAVDFRWGHLGPSLVISKRIHTTQSRCAHSIFYVYAASRGCTFIK